MIMMRIIIVTMIIHLIMFFVMLPRCKGGMLSCCFVSCDCDYDDRHIEDQDDQIYFDYIDYNTQA